MQVTIETINGKQCTVIRKPFDAEWVREQLSMGIPLTYSSKEFNNEVFYIDPRLWKEGMYFNDKLLADINNLITILPPLPRHPTKDDARLLYLYASHGLYAAFGIYQFAHMDDDGTLYVYGNAGLDMISSPEVTHAVNENGNRVDVAIKEGV